MSNEENEYNPQLYLDGIESDLVEPDEMVCKDRRFILKLLTPGPNPKATVIFAEVQNQHVVLPFLHLGPSGSNDRAVAAKKSLDRAEDVLGALEASVKAAARECADKQEKVRELAAALERETLAL